MKTRVHRHIRKTRKGRTIIKKHNRTLKNRNSHYIIFNPKKDTFQGLKEQDSNVIVHEEDTPEYSSRVDVGDMIVFNDDGSVREITPEINQTYSTLPKTNDDVSSMSEALEEIKKLFKANRFMVRKVTLPDFPKDEGSVLYTKVITSAINVENPKLKVEEARKFGKKK